MFLFIVKDSLFSNAGPVGKLYNLDLKPVCSQNVCSSFLKYISHGQCGQGVLVLCPLWVTPLYWFSTNDINYLSN